MMNYEKMHEQCRESLDEQWLEHTPHGKLFRLLEDYDSDQCPSRYSLVRSRLLCSRDEYVEAHWEEEWDGLCDSAAEAADPLGYRGLSRRDF